MELVGPNSKCPHCYKFYKERKGMWNYCKKGHRTLYLESIDQRDILESLIKDYKAWIPFYKKHHHWIKRIFDDRRKIFVKVLKRDQKNLFQLYPKEIDNMIKKAFDIGDKEHRVKKRNKKLT